MLIMGIDPGTVTMGYGIIEASGDEMTMVDYGAVVSTERSSPGERLSILYNELLKIISLHRPDAVAVEQPFVAKNVRTALVVGRAQATAMLAAANNGIPVFEYTPAQVKRHVANYGASSKEQVQEAVRLQLGLAETPQPNDAADALAVAICHLAEVHLSQLLEDSKT